MDETYKILEEMIINIAKIAAVMLHDDGHISNDQFTAIRESNDVSVINAILKEAV